uniref:Sialin n=1 Tax=Corethrella appendiculata TaxID=1370023 RepID=U5ERG1_9DIPT
MFWKSQRFVVVMMVFLGFFNVYSLSVNLSVAIVAMTETRNSTLENGTVISEKLFDWDSKQQGLILSSFFYGYICTMFAGGFLATKFGANYIFATGIGVTALLTLATPVAASSSLYLLLAIRIIEGVFEGVTFPCVHAIWSKWAPPNERSSMVTIGYAGNYAGTVIAYPMSGMLATTYGWESVFYVFGSMAVVWLLLFLLLISESPEKDWLISDGEKKYIMTSLKQNDGNNKKLKIPWKSMFSSPAVWAIVCAQFSENWGFYTLLTQLPTMLNDTIGYNLGKTGLLSALPYLTMGVLLGMSGFIADWLQNKGYLTTTQVRRYFNCVAFIAQTMFMVLAGYMQDPAAMMTSMTIGIGLGAFAWTGFAVNHLDIAPQYAGLLMGITNTFGTIPGIVSPMITGHIVQNRLSSEWRNVLFIAAGIYLFGCIVYWFWASGEVQDWAKENKSDDDDINNKDQVILKDNGLNISKTFNANNPKNQVDTGVDNYGYN